jgi:hypothetical protein
VPRSAHHLLADELYVEALAAALVAPDAEDERHALRQLPALGQVVLHQVQRHRVQEARRDGVVAAQVRQRAPLIHPQRTGRDVRLLPHELAHEAAQRGRRVISSARAKRL